MIVLSTLSPSFFAEKATKANLSGLLKSSSPFPNNKDAEKAIQKLVIQLIKVMFLSITYDLAS